MRPYEYRTFRIRLSADRKDQIDEIISAIASNGAALARASDAWRQKCNPSLDMPLKTFSRSCRATPGRRTPWFLCVVRAAVFRPRPSEFVEIDATVIWAAIKEHVCAALGTAGVRIDVAFDGSASVAGPTKRRWLIVQGEMRNTSPAAAAAGIAAEAAWAARRMIGCIAHRVYILLAARSPCLMAYLTGTLPGIRRSEIDGAYGMFSLKVLFSRSSVSCCWVARMFGF